MMDYQDSLPLWSSGRLYQVFLTDTDAIDSFGCSTVGGTALATLQIMPTPKIQAACPLRARMAA